MPWTRDRKNLIASLSKVAFTRSFWGLLDGSEAGLASMSPDVYVRYYDCADKYVAPTDIRCDTTALSSVVLQFHIYSTDTFNLWTPPRFSRDWLVSIMKLKHHWLKAVVSDNFVTLAADQYKHVSRCVL